MTCVRTWITWINKELEPTEQVTTTEKKQNPKIQEELRPEKNLQNITKKREK